MEAEPNQMTGENGGSDSCSKKIGKLVKNPGTQEPENSATPAAKPNPQLPPPAAARQKASSAPVVIPVEDDAPLINC